MPKELLTVSEFCEAANIGRTLAYELIAYGELKAVKVGRKTLIPTTSMHEWMQSLQPFKVMTVKSSV